MTKGEQFDILGGSDYTVVKLVCTDGNVVAGDVSNCHCHNLVDGVYLLRIPNDGTGHFQTFNLLGQEMLEA
ncbi:MAG: hypothetical protein AB8B65_05035 [Kordia sp.]|uniref:hypothetical protein n=1 Tax=Kordia sp. TaxID=1965332 RepID=UPI0038598014